jgi:hypothetical protein
VTGLWSRRTTASDNCEWPASATFDKPADLRSPRRIDCYVVAVENFAGRDSKKCKLNPKQILFSLQYQHNGVPPDFNLLLLGEPQRWFDAVATLLLGELNRRDPHLFDRLHTHG